MTRRITFAAVLSLLCLTTRGLERLHIRASSVVTVTLDHVVEGEHRYRDAEGRWRPLEVSVAPGRSRFILPKDAGPSTTVLLGIPDDLVLADDARPVLEHIEIGGREVSVAGSLTLGHLAPPYPPITLEARDAENAIDAAAVTVVLDGRELQEESLTRVGEAPVSRHWKGIVSVPEDIADGAHRLVCRIPDRAGVRNVLEVSLEFVTGPLISNGDFEDGTDGDAPPWTAMMWSKDATTQAELTIVEGEGRGNSRCARIKGIAGSLNLLYAQRLSLPVGARFRLSGWYRATHGGGYASLIGKDKTQYDSSPKFPATDSWSPFEWTFTVKPERPHTLYLRSSSQGTVWIDDLDLKQIEGP